MFNKSLKEEALSIHKNAVDRYNASYDAMCAACERLHSVRETSLSTITKVELLVSSIANRPKEFDKKLGEIKEQVLAFHQTKDYADKAYKEAKKAGINIASGVAAGASVAAAAPSVAMSIATTFGTATTGTAIRSLSGAAAQKAALAWIGRQTAGIATKGVIAGAGMQAGQAFLALAGPIGWSITGATTAVSLISLNKKNKKISEEAISEAKEIMAARELLRETADKVGNLRQKTYLLKDKLDKQLVEAEKYRNMDYSSLPDETRTMLGTLVNNTWSLSALLNQTVE